MRLRRSSGSIVADPPPSPLVVAPAVASALALDREASRVAGADPDDAVEAATWAARALVRQALAEAEPEPARRGRRTR
jgi:hypothetical protein